MKNEETYDMLSKMMDEKLGKISFNLDSINIKLKDCVKTSGEIIEKLDSIIETADRILENIGH